jgi:hypothetical protein
MTREEKNAFFMDRKRQVVEGIEIVGGVKVRLFSKEDIKDIDSSFFPVSNKVLRERISTRTYVLEKYITVEKDHGFETDKIMRNIVLALRLLQEGYVYGDDVFYFLFSDGKWRYNSWSREGPQLREDRIGWGYSLNFEDMPNLISLAKKIQSIDFSKRKSLELACKRFQRAYEEDNIEDQIIDYMIAFEALFLKGEKRVSSRGKIIAIACSTLLGNNDEEREEIKNTLNTAYSMRNSIVHGAEYTKDVNPFVVVEEIRHYLRDSIKRFLD